MASLLQRNLIVVTGKGGTGKTTIAAAIGLLAARHGRRTVIVDTVGDGGRLRRLFAADGQLLAPGLSLLTIEPEAALAEWMQTLGGRLPTALLTSRSSFQYFAAAAPGARELVTLLKVASVAGGRDAPLVVLDAPATGHALAMLDSPRTFAAIARVGPIATEAERVRELLRDRRRSGYLAVCAASEMAVTETLELADGLRERIEVEIDAVVVNATVSRRFTGAELGRIADVSGDGARAGQRRVLEAALAAARSAHARSRRQQNQIARLRRDELLVLQVPFVFEPDLDLAALQGIADRLEGGL